MGDLPRYRKIYRLPTPGSTSATVRQGYEYWPSPRAASAWSVLFEGQRSALTDKSEGTPQIQGHLLNHFLDGSQPDDHQVLAGLCLRCYISPSILKSCIEQASRFAGTADRHTIFLDLLSEILDDDGETSFLLSDGEWYVLDEAGNRQPATYRCFSMEILGQYDYQSPNRKSLANWAYYVTSRHERLKSVLKQGGFQRLSNWALMNRAGASQLEGVSQRSRHLVEVYQAVYRRDRLKQRERDGQSLRGKKCLEPTVTQLEEMLTRLRDCDIIIQSPPVLLAELRQIAQELQDDDLWRRLGRPNAEPLEPPDPETGLPTVRQDIPSTVVNEPERLEYEGILQFIRKQQLFALQYGIQQGIEDRLTEIRQSGYREHAPKLLPGLRLIYSDGLSQRKIREHLDFSSQSLAARVLAPKDLINQARFRTLEKLLDIILAKANEMGLTAIPPRPDYLSNLMRQLELLVDSEIFDEARQELQNPGKDRSFDSLYATELRLFLQ
jgi:hypothetical protein